MNRAEVTWFITLAGGGIGSLGYHDMIHDGHPVVGLVFVAIGFGLAVWGRYRT